MKTEMWAYMLVNRNKKQGDAEYVNLFRMLGNIIAIYPTREYAEKALLKAKSITMNVAVKKVYITID